MFFFGGGGGGGGGFTYATLGMSVKGQLRGRQLSNFLFSQKLLKMRSICYNIATC